MTIAGRVYAVEFGEVTIGTDVVELQASAFELHEWANRPGHAWPCSVLARLDSIVCRFDSGGLCDLDAEHRAIGADIPADEFNAWSSDVLAPILPESHPAWFYAVGLHKAD